MKSDLIRKIESAKELKSSELILDLGQLGIIPDELYECNFIKKLTLINIKELDTKIMNLIKLEALTLNNSMLTDLPLSMKYLSNLESLQLQNCNIRKMPQVIFMLLNLKELLIISGKLRSIPKQITKLKKLTYLNLSANNIKRVPEYLLAMKNLDSLWLYDNKIESGIEYIFEMRSIEALSIAKNPINDPIDGIGKLEKLKQLRLSHLGLEEIPDVIYNLKELWYLDISENKLEEVDERLCNLKSLAKLISNNNKLSKIPNNIGLLENLVELRLGKNKIKEIPNSIGCLNKLKYLLLEDNNIEKIPSSIGGLSNLESINLSNNNIQYFPSELSMLKKLINSDKIFYRHGFDITGNPINLPEELYDKDPEELIRYILDVQQSTEKKPLHEAKLIFIGTGEVGKTSLANMILNGNIGNPEKTKGIEIRDWKVNCNKNIIKLHVWDFGGQEIMHATHKFFMTSRSVYIIVVNPRAEDKYGESELEYWLKLVSSYAGNVPVVVAINKCEIHMADIGKGELQDKYSNIIGFVETSCVNGLGIDELKALISKSISKLDHLNFPLPKSYFQIKEMLEKQNKDYIQYTDYEKICKKIDSNIIGESMQTLVGILNDLGVMLNFRNSNSNIISLRDTQVLNPEWVTKGVYQVIASIEVVLKKGILTIEEVSFILDKIKYPTIKEHRYIMDIMQRFELCFQVPDNIDSYFIPGAFPKDRPEFEWNSDSTIKILFQFSYDVMPSSIMSRFIVKIHKLIRNNDYWRNGVIIKKDNCEALIKADPSDKKIVIEVVGEGNKRDFMSFIRGQFDLIHENLKGINATKYIILRQNGREALIDYDLLILHERHLMNSIVVKELNKVVSVTHLLNGLEDESVREEVAASVADKTKNEEFNNRRLFAELDREKQVHKILFITSNPDDTSWLRLDREIRSVEEGLSRAKARDSYKLVKKLAARTSDFRRALLEEEPFILHYSGHGSYEGIVLEDETGMAKTVSNTALSNLLNLFKDKIKCVVLNSCYSEDQANEIVKHIPYVIGMSDSVGDDSAIMFSSGFYEALGAGRDIEFAFKYAINAIETDGLSGCNIPILKKDI